MGTSGASEMSAGYALSGGIPYSYGQKSWPSPVIYIKAKIPQKL